MNRITFYEHIRMRGPFGKTFSKTQVDGINLLLDAVNGRPISHAAYLLATAWHETGGTMRPEREAFGKTDEDTINRLNRAWKAGKLGQVKAPYWRKDQSGRAWFGRGYVQLTHIENYRRASAVTGVDLVGDPSLAMRPDIAAKILVDGCEAGIFTGKKLSDYLPGDYVNARRVVNGTDKAQQIATYARAFESALQAAGYSVAKKYARKPEPPLVTPSTPPLGIAAAIAAALAALAVFFDKLF